jgi:hypothetical protein
MTAACARARRVASTAVAVAPTTGATPVRAQEALGFAPIKYVRPVVCAAAGSAIPAKPTNTALTSRDSLAARPTSRAFASRAPRCLARKSTHRFAVAIARRTAMRAWRPPRERVCCTRVFANRPRAGSISWGSQRLRVPQNSLRPIPREGHDRVLRVHPQIRRYRRRIGNVQSLVAVDAPTRVAYRSRGVFAHGAPARTMRLRERSGTRRDPVLPPACRRSRASARNAGQRRATTSRHRCGNTVRAPPRRVAKAL